MIGSVCSLSPSDAGDFYIAKQLHQKGVQELHHGTTMCLSFCTALREAENGSMSLWNRGSRRRAFHFWGECFQVAWNLQLCGSNERFQHAKGSSRRNCTLCSPQQNLIYIYLLNSFTVLPQEWQAGKVSLHPIFPFLPAPKHPLLAYLHTISFYFYFILKLCSITPE